MFAVLAEIFDPSVAGPVILRMLGASALIALGLIASGPLARWVVHRLLRGIRRVRSLSEDEFDRDLITRIAQPLRLIPLAIACQAAVSISALSGPAVETAGRILVSMVEISVFWTLLRLANSCTFLFKSLQEKVGPAIFDWAVKTVDITLLIVGAAVVMETWEIHVGTVLAGLGIFGVAVALGAQDLFKNLIAGVLILVEKRFGPGDWINIDGVAEGVVQKINFRSTLIERFDKAPLYVPNTKLSDGVVTNFSRMTHRRIKWMIGVEYGSEVEQIQRIRNAIEDYLMNSDDFAKPPEVPLFVRVDKFSASSIDILIYCFTRTTDWAEWLHIKETFAIALKRIVAEAGTGFAFPSRTLYIHSLDGKETDRQAEIAPPSAQSEALPKIPPKPPKPPRPPKPPKSSTAAKPAKR